MSDIVQIIRIIVYEGDREWVESTLKHTAIPLNGDFNFFGEGKRRVIKSKTLGDFPTIMKIEEDVNKND
jgi:hypothetical protein